MVAAAGALLLLVGHALLRAPRPAPLLRREADGLWSVPELGLAGLGLGSRTRYTTLWVRLALVGPARAFYILLLADQLDADSWRRLQAALRRGAPARPEGGPDRDRPELR